MPPSFPIIGFQGEVVEDWVDMNGHMNSMAYANLFWSSLSPLFGRIGISTHYVRERRMSIFQREAHISWDKELLLGTPILIRSWLVGFDERRIHHFHELWNEAEDERAASMEYLSVHIDMAARRSGDIPDDIRHNLEGLSSGFSKLPPPTGAGRAIRIERSDRTRRAGAATLSADVVA